MSSRPTTLPNGAKLWLLDLGYVNLDAGMVLAGANMFPADSPPQLHERRDLIMIAALVHHPDVGLILFDTGSCEDALGNWGEEALRYGPRAWDKEKNGLPETIKRTGAGDIKDVKAVVLSHLHIDHAGGLEHFFGTDVEIWCHEEELKHAFWTYATGLERGGYGKHYLTLDQLNWKTFSGKVFQPYQGITLHHTPGHTVGSIVMELEMEKSGCVVITGDAFHVKENWEKGIHPGGLTTQLYDWHKSHEFLRALIQRKHGRVVLGHEPAYFKALKQSPEYEE